MEHTGRPRRALDIWEACLRHVTMREQQDVYERFRPRNVFSLALWPIPDRFFCDAFKNTINGPPDTLAKKVEARHGQGDAAKKEASAKAGEVSGTPAETRRQSTPAQTRRQSTPAVTYRQTILSSKSQTRRASSIVSDEDSFQIDPGRWLLPKTETVKERILELYVNSVMSSGTKARLINLFVVLDFTKKIQLLEDC